MEVLYPLLFEQKFYEVVWGGNKLKPLKGIPADNKPIGESWEVSAVPGKESVVANGSLKGRKLTELADEYKELLLGKKVQENCGGKFPLLIKFIDAVKDLSIQVHPDDELAKKRHNSLGKTEMWYVVDAEEDAHLYSGFSTRISKSEYAKRVEDGSICDVLQRHEARKGDVFFIPSGRVHAICGGTMVAEVQESSDITYRIFDYKRLGLDGRPRELHTELAKDAIDYNVYDNYRTDYTETLNEPAAISESRFFTVNVHNIDRPCHRTLFDRDSFIVYMCLEGDCRIEAYSVGKSGNESREAGCVELGKGYTCLIPAACADVNIVPKNPGTAVKLLEIYIDNSKFNR